MILIDMMTTLQAVSLQPSSGACFAKESGPREGLEGDWEGEDLKVQMTMICEEDVLISGNIQTTNPVNISHVLEFTHLIKRPSLKKHTSCKGGPHTKLGLLCLLFLTHRSQQKLRAVLVNGGWELLLETPSPVKSPRCSNCPFLTSIKNVKMLDNMCSIHTTRSILQHRMATSSLQGQSCRQG